MWSTRRFRMRGPATSWAMPILATLGFSASEAAIPPYAQTSLTSEADIKIHLPPNFSQDGRYAFEDLSYDLAADPADPTRRAVQLTTNGSGTFWFEETLEPPTLMVEWEQYHSQAGGSGCVFFTIVDADGNELTFQRLANSTRFANVPGSGNVTWSENLPLDQWVRLRLEYTARSSGPGSNDGSIVLKMDTGLGLITVATRTDHDMTNVAGIGPWLTIGSTTSRLAVWRKLIWDGSGQDVYGAAANPDSLWRDIGHQLGAMEPDGMGGLRSKVWVHYNVGLYGETTTPGGEYAALVEVDTDANFSSPLTQMIPVSGVTGFNGVATFAGLLPNSTYNIRATFKRDDVVVATTYPTSFRTLSAPKGLPGKFHLVHGSCAKTKDLTTPNSVFRTAFSNAPRDATLIFSHIGDLQYPDQLLHYTNAPPGPDNPNATDALFDRTYDQMFLSEAFNELASHAICWFMWDDHEVFNGWSGVGLGGPDEADPALFEMALNAAHRWWADRLPDETSRDRLYFHVETARCLFIYLDVRRHGDHVTTLVGAEQKIWVEQLLEAKPKPLVFLLSPTTWSSGASSELRRRESWHDHTAERNEIINHFLLHNTTGHLFLLSGDTHFGMHNTSEFQAFGPRVHGDWMSGVYSTGMHSPKGTQWQPGGLFEADHIETFGVPDGEFARGYATVDIDEKNLEVRIAFVNGLTGEETYVVQELPTITGDLNGDGTVGIVDFLMLLAAWGPCEAPCPPACLGDIDGDCVVGITDMLALLANWG